VIGSHITGSRKIVLRKPTEPLFRDLSEAETPKQMEQKEYQEPWFCTVDLQPCGAEVVADDGAGNPVLLRNDYGKGAVYLSVPEYMMEGLGDYGKRLSFFESMVRGLAGHGPISVTAPGSASPQADISWIASYQTPATMSRDLSEAEIPRHADVVVVIANHGSSRQSVDVTWRGGCKAAAIEVGKGDLKSRRQADSSVFSLDVQSEDVALLRIRR